MSAGQRKGTLRRTALFVFLIVALAFSQAAAQLHGLSHAAYDLANSAPSGKNLPPPHPAEQCIPFHAVDSALPILAFALEPPRADLQAPLEFVLPLAQPPRIVFDSRAPPQLA